MTNRATIVFCAIRSPHLLILGDDDDDDDDDDDNNGFLNSSTR